MPELPEVETIRLGLNRVLMGRKIKDVTVRVPKLFSGDVNTIVGATIVAITRRAKILLIELDNQRSILIHLKMTGQLVYQSKDEKDKIVGGHPQQVYNQPLPHLHTHIIFTFDDDSKLFFNDLRKFGWMQVVPTADAATFGMLKTVGPEPLDDSFTIDVLRERLSRYPNRPIFIGLLDQTIIAGIGNIYANEALYEAGIRPERKIKDIQAGEWPKLWQAIRHVLQESIRHGGTSHSTYRTVDGKKGDYLTFAHVYHKKMASPCGHEVVRQKLGGRTIHFCPIDQT